MLLIETLIHYEGVLLKSYDIPQLVLYWSFFEEGQVEAKTRLV